MIFGSTIGRKIPTHKGNTLAHGVKVISEPSAIYIPTVTANGTALSVLVKRGDKVKAGQKVAENTSPYYVPFFSSVSGRVVDMVDRHLSNGNVVKHIMIENDFKDTTTKEIKQVSYAHDAENILEAIKQAGIVGMGGAGFPTYVKYQSGKGCHTLVINAVECEPYITADKFATTEGNNAIRMIEGALLAKKAIGAANVIFAVKKDNKVAYEALITALANIEHDDKESVSIKKVASKFPMGWERVLIRHLFKKEYTRFPSELGIVVSNAQTVLAIQDALINGNVLTSKYVTFAGDAFASERTVKVKNYTCISHVKNELGGLIFDNVTITLGGPMMGKALVSDQVSITSCSNAVIAQEACEYIELPCLRCGKCIDHCPAGLQPVKIKEAFEFKDWDRLIKLDADACISCGLCSWVCPSKIELTHKLSSAKLVAQNKKAQAQAKNKVTK